MSSSAQITFIIYVFVCICVIIFMRKDLLDESFCSDYFSLERCYLLEISLKGVLWGELSATVFAPDFLCFLLKVLDYLSMLYL